MPRLLTRFREAGKLRFPQWGCGAAGSAREWHSRGHGFDPRQLHQLPQRRMWLTVGERRFAITLTRNAAARAFAAQFPLTLDMSELNGNEKHAELSRALPAKASRPGTIRNGDLMLYGTDTLVVFYSTFQSSYWHTLLVHGKYDPYTTPAERLA